MIEVNKLCKEMDSKTILQDVSINVKKGSIYGLVGPNGAGKTTLIKHLAGIYQKNSGSVKILGEEVYDNKIIKSKVAFIPDELYFPQYTVNGVAKLYAKIYPEFSWERYNKLKEYIRIDEHMKISKMSKGMKKQVAFWLVISRMPEVIILDEPVDGLDPIARKKIWSLLIQDVSNRDTTVLVSSHNLRELEDVCDTVGIMHKGKVIVERELDQLKSNVLKVQVAFRDEVDVESLGKEMEILNVDRIGSVYMMIVRGDKDGIMDTLKKHNPILSEALSLTLEEVFMYEVRGAGYEIEDVIL